MNLHSLGRIGVALLALSSIAAAATITIPNNGSTVFFQESPSGSAVRTLGQTFVVPTPTSENILTSFGFAFASGTDTSFDYKAMIYAWDTVNNRATGSALYTSPNRTGATAPSFTGLNLALTPGTVYIAFLTTQNVVSNGFSNGLLNHNSGNVYSGGQAFQQTSSGPTGTDVTTAAWTAVNGNTDFQFNATFVSGGASVPEPSSFGMAMLGIAALGLGIFRRR